MTAVAETPAIDIEPTPVEVVTGGPRLLRPLRLHDFRLLWAGESISTLGDQFQFVAMAWLVLGLTGSGLALGLVLTAAAVPRAALMLLGGAVSDRFSPRSVLLVSNALRGVLVGILAVLVLSGTIQLVHVVVLAVVFGVCDAFFYPAIGALLPRLVDRETLLPSANALFQGTTQLMGLLGPPLAGVMIAATQTGTAFALNAASFGVAAVALLMMRWRAPRHAASAVVRDAGAGSILASIRAGIAYVWRDDALRLLLLMAAVINFAFTGPEAVGLAWLSAGRWGAGALGYGLLTGAFALGALAGAATAGSMGQPRRRSRILVGVAAALGVGLAAVGLAPALWMALLIVVPMGFGAGLINVLAISWMQARVEVAMLGRVMSLTMLAGVGLAPVSLAIAGLLVDIAVVPLFVGAGAVVLVTAVLGVTTGAARRLDDDRQAGTPARRAA
ncbi:MAG: MFS transporter [Candidatus Limnocylindrales bacterium]